MDAKSLERRRAIRYFFGGVAEVTDVESGKHLVSETTELGRFGCFVKTIAPFSPGATVSLKITHQDTFFAAPGRVAYVLADKGMGISFGAVSPEDEAVLEHWLPHSTEEERISSPSWTPRV